MTKSKHDDIPPELDPADIVPEPAPSPSTVSATVGYQGSEFQPGWRSALDDPNHPLHHLRDA
jgi:hypothetical protein